MKALLLSAGLGTRLRPITNTIPKCLVPICGRPLMEYWLQLLINAGIDSVLVNTHYLANQVKEYINKSNLRNHVVLVHEDSLLGTGGTVLKNSHYINNEPFILIHGDNLSLFDMREFINKFNSRPIGIEITMMTFTTDVPESCGIVTLDNNGIVSAFYEKQKDAPGNLANGAVYILSQKVAKYMESLQKEVVDFSVDVIPYFIGRINTFHNNVYHRDIGTPLSLEIAQSEFCNILKTYQAKLF